MEARRHVYVLFSGSLSSGQECRSGTYSCVRYFSVSPGGAVVLDKVLLSVDVDASIHCRRRPAPSSA